MARRVATLVEGACPRCCQWHDEPTACTHEMDKPCPRCGRAFGGLCPDMLGDVCWRCHDADGVQRMARGQPYLLTRG